MNEEIQAGALYGMPATPLQVRLWTLERSAAPDPAWNVAVRFRLSGPLDREKLESALQFMIRRHEALRTSLALHRDVVVECIAEHRSLPVEWCDLRALYGEAQSAEVIRLSLEHARQLLPLGSAPLFRVRLLRLRDDEHLMLWNAHHAVCDGWSVGLLARDLMNVYGELSVGREPAPKNSLDYGDYAVWLEEQRRRPEYELHRSYWKRRLRGRRIPQLPSSWRNSDSEPAASVIHSRLLPRALTDRLIAVSQRHNATFFHAALSVFALLLRAQQESPEVAVGTPVSGRDQSELEEIVGTFVNYLPLRLRVHGDRHYIDLLHSIRELVADSLEHSQFRFEDMLADLAQSRQWDQSGGLDQAGNGLFSAAFICQQDFVRPLTSAGVSLTAVPSVTPGALHPLTVFMVERPDGWRLSCEVDNRIVSAAAGLTLLEQFERLMTAVAGHPDESVTLLAARVGLAFVATHEAVSAEKSNTSASQEQPAADRVEGRRELVRIPATEFQRRFWHLDKMNPGGTAFHVRVRLELNGALNVGLLRKAVELLTERHEILRTTLEDKDGQIWQVIHPELPIDFRFISSGSLASENLFSKRELSADQAILEAEGHAKFSLTHGPLFRVRVLQLEKERHWLAITLSHGAVDGWSAGLFLEQLQHAYEQCVAGFRTEAETIAPLQFSDYAAAERNLLASGERDRRLAWWSKYLSGVWMPLSLPRDLDGSFIKDGDIRAGLEVTALSPEAVLLAKRFARECQTTLFAVFGALFQTLLFRYSGQQDMLFLTPHANRTDDTETIMGPLADPICLTAHIDHRTTFRQLVTRFSDQSMNAMENALPLNIVTPLVDMRVAGGYHPLNQITFFYQRAFVHDMEWKGLRVQSLPDAPSVASSEWQLGVVERGEGISLEFLYDATLYSQRTIQTAGRHFLRLLARAIAEPENALSQLEILASEEVERHSPDLTVLPAIQALLPHKEVPPPPAVAPIAITGEAAEIASSSLSQAELDILRIWRQLFKVEDLNLDSDFFDLGGHSLLLARLQIAIKKEFNLQLTAAEVFRQPTVASLAAWLERSRLAAKQEEGRTDITAAHNPRIVPIQPAGTGRPIFVISQSMIFRTLAAELGPNQPVYAIQMLDQDTLAMGAATFEELVDFYVRMIRKVQPNGPYRLAGWCVSGWIAYGVARQLENQGAEVELLAVIDAWAPAYWGDQPPMRKRLMLAVYEIQRSRWIARRLRRAGASRSGSPVQHAFDRLSATAQKAMARLRREPPAEARETEEMRRLGQLQRTASRAALTGPLQGKIILFRSEEEPTGLLLAPDMGWGKVVGRSVKIEVLPGDHHQIFEIPGARMMAMRVREVLGTSGAGFPAPGTAPNGGASTPAGRNIPLVEA